MERAKRDVHAAEAHLVGANEIVGAQPRQRLERDELADVEPIVSRSGLCWLMIALEQVRRMTIVAESTLASLSATIF